MRTWTIAMLSAAATLCAFAQEIPEFAAWMKAKDGAAKAIRKLDPKTGPDAVGNAETLAAIYENMIGFWRQRNAADAVKWSEEGKAAAVAMATAAHAGNAEAAASAFQTLEGGCKRCHDVHRVRLANGRYAIRSDPGRPRQRKK